MENNGYDAIVVDNEDPKGKNRIKIRVQGHHPGDLPEDQLPWCLVQPKIGANSGKGQKEVLSPGQFCKVKALDKAKTEFIITGGSNAFRKLGGSKGKPYSVIINPELFDVPIPDLASLDPAKLARTIFVPLMDKLTKRLSEPVKPFLGCIGTILGGGGGAGCGGGAAGCGGPGVPPPNANGDCPQKPLGAVPKIVCPGKAGGGTGPKPNTVDLAQYNNIVGCEPIACSLKYEFYKEVQTLSGGTGTNGGTKLVPCNDDDIEIVVKSKESGNPRSGCWEASGNTCEGIDSGCNTQYIYCEGLALVFPENIPCPAASGLQTNNIQLDVYNKHDMSLPPLEVSCSFCAGDNSCDAAQNLPGGANNPFAADDPFALGYHNLHEFMPPTPVETITIDFDNMKWSTESEDPVTYVKSQIQHTKNQIKDIQSYYRQTAQNIRNLPQTLTNMAKAKAQQVLYNVGKSLADQASKYVNKMFGNMVNQANRILGKVKAAAVRSLNTAMEGAIKVIDKKIEEIQIEIVDQVVGGLGLGAVPGAFFHEILRTDFLGTIEHKFVTQFENGIAQVVDTSLGNKVWSLGTNDGARIEIGNTGTTLIKGANDVQIATQEGTVNVTGANAITIVDKKATIHCDSFSVKAKTIDLYGEDAIALHGDVEISGKVGIGGTLEVKGKIASKIDVIAQKSKTNYVSLHGHLHKLAAGGATLPPITKPSP